jgi:hypothetical protein
MLQLNPTIPITRTIDNMKGYAFLVIDYSQEHDLLFTCAMDNGEIWTYSNKDIKIQNNISLNRKIDDYIKPPLQTSLKDNLTAPNGTIHSGTKPNNAHITVTSLSSTQHKEIVAEIKNELDKLFKF